MYPHIERIIDSINKRCNSSDESFDDIMADVIADEVGHNSLDENRNIIEYHYNVNVTDAMNKFKRENGENVDITKFTDERVIYGLLAINYICDEVIYVISNIDNFE